MIKILFATKTPRHQKCTKGILWMYFGEIWYFGGIFFIMDF